MVLVRRLAIFTVAFYMLLGVALGVLKARESKAFTQERLEYLLETPSGMRDVTSDPCAYSIMGDPVRNDDEFSYVKVVLDCGDSEALNTMQLNILDDTSVIGVLRELGRVLGFEVALGDDLQLGELGQGGEQRWRCGYGVDEFVDWTEEIRENSTLTCVFR